MDLPRIASLGGGSDAYRGGDALGEERALGQHGLVPVTSSVSLPSSRNFFFQGSLPAQHVEWVDV